MLVTGEFLRARKRVNGDLPDINCYKLFLVILESHYGNSNELKTDELKTIMGNKLGTSICNKIPKLIEELRILEVDDIVAIEKIACIDNCIKFKFTDDFDKAFPGSLF